MSRAMRFSYTSLPIYYYSYVTKSSIGKRFVWNFYRSEYESHCHCICSMVVVSGEVYHHLFDVGLPDEGVSRLAAAAVAVAETVAWFCSNEELISISTVGE